LAASYLVTSGFVLYQEEWEKLEAEKRAKRLELARIEEDAARARRKLLEIENREQEYARRDWAYPSIVS
jgi:chromosome segregation ATPase